MNKPREHYVPKNPGQSPSEILMRAVKDKAVELIQAEGSPVAQRMAEEDLVDRAVASGLLQYREEILELDNDLPNRMCDLFSPMGPFPEYLSEGERNLRGLSPLDLSQVEDVPSLIGELNL